MREIDRNPAELRSHGQDPEALKATVRASLKAVEGIDIEAITRAPWLSVDPALIERSLPRPKTECARPSRARCRRARKGSRRSTRKRRVEAAPSVRVSGALRDGGVHGRGKVAVDAPYAISKRLSPASAGCSRAIPRLTPTPAPRPISRARTSGGDRSRAGPSPIMSTRDRRRRRLARRIAAIACTHTHRDHSPAAARWPSATGAPIIGCAPLAWKASARAPTPLRRGLCAGPGACRRRGDRLRRRQNADRRRHAGPYLQPPLLCLSRRACSPAIMSWAGRPPWSSRPTATWGTTWPASTSSGSATTASIIPRTARR